jgi:hypothetical protein
MNYEAKIDNIDYQINLNLMSGIRQNNLGEDIIEAKNIDLTLQYALIYKILLINKRCKLASKMISWTDIMR